MYTYLYTYGVVGQRFLFRERLFLSIVYSLAMTYDVIWQATPVLSSYSWSEYNTNDNNVGEEIPRMDADASYLRPADLISRVPLTALTHRHGPAPA